MSQPIPTSYNQIIAHTIEQALALSANAKNENAIAGFCQLHDVGKVRTSGAHWEKTSSSRICSTRPVQAADDREAESAQI